MKVNDLVRTRQATDGDNGIVLSVEYIKAGEYWVTYLWQGGEIEGICNKDLEVVREAG